MIVPEAEEPTAPGSVAICMVLSHTVNSGCLTGFNIVFPSIVESAGSSDQLFFLNRSIRLVRNMPNLAMPNPKRAWQQGRRFGIVRDSA